VENSEKIMGLDFLRDNILTRDHLDANTRVRISVEILVMIL
jgi:hypothetical protein